MRIVFAQAVFVVSQTLSGDRIRELGQGLRVRLSEQNAIVLAVEVMLCKVVFWLVALIGLDDLTPGNSDYGT